jgi:hypothetical protein
MNSPNLNLYFPISNNDGLERERRVAEQLKQLSAIPYEYKIFPLSININDKDSEKNREFDLLCTIYLHAMMASPDKTVEQILDDVEKQVRQSNPDLVKHIDRLRAHFKITGLSKNIITTMNVQV